MKKFMYCLFIVCIASSLYSKPGCQQIGNRLSSWGDSKNFTYVACACPCDEYPQLPKSQCSECKHYHLLGSVPFEFLKPNIKEAHRLYKKENS